MNTTLRRLFTCAAAGALAVSLAACGPDDASTNSSQLLSANGSLDPGWSMMDLAGVDPAFIGGESAALPEALPMAASYSGGSGSYSYAPSYDYAPDRDDSYYAPLDDSAYYDDGYHDDGYYEDGYYDGGYYDAGSYDDGYDEGYYNLGNDGSDYGLLALAVSLAGVFGNSPPDYGYSYDDVSPWAWRTGDGYYRYAEPIDDGYRYYYYEPNSYRPFLVSDPYYSYGYRDDRLVAIYDRGGRRIDARRAEMQLRAAKAYYARADRLHDAAQRDRYGVPAPLWERHRDTISHDRDRWYREQAERPAWQRWESRNKPKLYRQWTNEALVRRDSERRFDGWQRAEYKTPAPAFYTPTVRQQQVTRIAELRRDRASEVAERRRERDERRVEQQRETRVLAQRAQEARRERTRELAERREQAPDRRERGIAISDIRERNLAPSLPTRIAERREERAQQREERRAERPTVAQRVERERPTAAARQEVRRAEIAKARAERPTPQARAQQQQAKREQRQAAAPAKRAQPAERVRAERAQPQARTEPRREAPAPRAERQSAQRQAREARQAAPERASRPAQSRPEQTRAAPQPRADRAERQQAMQQRSEARQQARQERTEARQQVRQQAAPQPRAERPQPRQQARQEAASQPRPERQARAEPAQRQQQAEARQQARQERQDNRAAQREERRQRPS